MELHAEISAILYQTYLLKNNWEYALPCQEPSLVPTDPPTDRPSTRLSPLTCPQALGKAGAVATLGLPERLSETLVPSYQSLLMAALPSNKPWGDTVVLKASMFRSLQQSDSLRFPLLGAYSRDAPAQGRDATASLPTSPCDCTSPSSCWSEPFVLSRVLLTSSSFAESVSDSQ